MYARVRCRSRDDDRKGGRREKEESQSANPCLVTAPIPPLPEGIKRPENPIVSLAGARPRGRQDGAASRHDLAPQLGVSLLFNCFKAKFEVHSRRSRYMLPD